MALELPGSHRATGLVDVLDRVLDKGLVIAGDIKVSLAEVELLTIRIRLLVCSLDKAQEIGRFDNKRMRAQREGFVHVVNVVGCRQDDDSDIVELRLELNPAKHFEYQNGQSWFVDELRRRACGGVPTDAL